jgi:hypothetical protein
MNTWNDEISYGDNGTALPAGMVPDDVTMETAHVAAPAPDEIPMSTWDTQYMAGQGAQDLIAREDEIMSAVGLALDDGDLYYARGTALAEIGHQNLSKYARDFQALPAPEDAIREFKSTIASEGRQDLIRDLADKRIAADGTLTGKNDMTTGYGLMIPDGGTAWKALTEIAGTPNVNAGLAKRTKAERRIRTRETAHGDREAFAIVSTDQVKGYKVYDGPEVADQVGRALRDRSISGAKVQITYDRESTRYQIRATVQAPIDIPALAGVGRIHQAFLQVSGGDDGQTAFRGQMGALRIRCLNASLAESTIGTWRHAHKGDLSALRGLIAGQVDSFGDLAASLSAAWSDAACHHYLHTDGTALSVKEAVTRLVYAKHVPAPGGDKDAAIERYMAAWRAEDHPSSAAGIIMAIQRAAHESTWSTSWATPEIEQAASGLLYQQVYTLPEIEMD